MTLSEIKATFQNLSPVNQILLLDALSDLTDWGDELTEGLQAMARCEAGDFWDADGIIPQHTHDITAWDAHRVARDHQLELALAWRIKREAA